MVVVTVTVAMLIDVTLLAVSPGVVMGGEQRREPRSGQETAFVRIHSRALRAGRIGPIMLLRRAGFQDRSEAGVADCSATERATKDCGLPFRAWRDVEVEGGRTPPSRQQILLRVMTQASNGCFACSESQHKASVTANWHRNTANSVQQLSREQLARTVPTACQDPRGRVPGLVVGGEPGGAGQSIESGRVVRAKSHSSDAATRTPEPPRCSARHPAENPVRDPVGRHTELAMAHGQCGVERFACGGPSAASISVVGGRWTCVSGVAPSPSHLPLTVSCRETWYCSSPSG
ncbi:hypothetical protein B0T16DRAFT_137919 [Cercophora newfieldiana]|uniref:Secreted protein n=1 Tax=Cercophora newfieldiana TaxID=92897 RepID=A0AA39YC25_9PEZI|nr:hypothetical protein B0T16DRAFT_137919 [Cercophora newfieldiana]